MRAVITRVNIHHIKTLNTEHKTHSWNYMLHVPVQTRMNIERVQPQRERKKKRNKIKTSNIKLKLPKKNHVGFDNKLKNRMGIEIEITKNIRS